MGRLMTVYVVTSGSYSDYGIEGIFSTREKAQAYIDLFRGEDGKDRHCDSFNDIEEKLLDELEGSQVYWRAGTDWRGEVYVGCTSGDKIPESRTERHAANAYQAVSGRPVFMAGSVTFTAYGRTEADALAELERLKAAERTA